MQTLLGVQVGRRLVDQIDVGRLAQAQRDGYTLQLTTGQVAHLLVHDVLDLQRLEHVRVELWMYERVADAHLDELLDGALELGADLLRLVGDVELGRLGLAVRLEVAGEDADERGLAGAVLAEQHDDLRVGEGATLDVELEVAELLRHARIRVVVQTLDLIVLGLLDHLEGEHGLAEAQILGGHEAVEENVYAFAHRERHRHHAIVARRAVQATNVVGQVVEHGQVVLDHYNVALLSNQAADDLGSLETLLHVQVTRRFVEHEAIFVHIIMF